MKQTTNYKIELKPDCFHPACVMIIQVPNDWDTEEYIDQYLESILNDDMKYNAEWDFV